jgi:hypothetical protein
MKTELQDIDLKWEKLEDDIYDGVWQSSVWQSQIFFDTCFVIQHEYDENENRDIYNAFIGDPMLDQGLCTGDSFVKTENKCKEYAINQINKLLK